MQVAALVKISWNLASIFALLFLLYDNIDNCNVRIISGFTHDKYRVILDTTAMTALIIYSNMILIQR